MEMDLSNSSVLKNKLTPGHWNTLKDYPKNIINFVAEYARLAAPDSIYICGNSPSDGKYIQTRAIQTKEEIALANPGHTIHFDGYKDQGHDKKNLFVVSPPHKIPAANHLNTIGQSDFQKQSNTLISDCMAGKTAILSFYCLGSETGPFCRYCVQLTDSFYLAHTQNLLYKTCLPDSWRMPYQNKPYFFFHSSGVLTKKGFSKQLKKRRIFIDVERRQVVSVNTQYAGNAGIKNNAMRLSIYDGIQNRWLCEHMCLFGVPSGQGFPVTYFAGAFPAGCGLRDTYAQPEYRFGGDDFVYIHNLRGEARALNPEKGMFGILQDTPLRGSSPLSSIFNKGTEVVFSNILKGPDNHPYWPGMDTPAPTKGTNHSGPGWRQGKTDKKGRYIPLGHPNGRFATELENIGHYSPSTMPPDGVNLHALLFGGRDSDTSVPVEESPGWKNGLLLKGCTLETESTSATLKREGLWFPNLMANADYIPVSPDLYIQNLLKVGESFTETPRIFTVNYFLKDITGDYCNSKKTKKVWLHWAALRVHNQIEAHAAPLGYIPKFGNLKILFEKLLQETYYEEEYRQQFKFRCANWMGKIQRIRNFITSNCPQFTPEIAEYWDQAAQALDEIRKQQGPIIFPGEYKGKPIPS